MLETSTIVRARDFRTRWLHRRATELGEPWRMHRKLWEFAQIAQVYAERLVFGGRVLGFGVGREPLPAWFACRGADVVATDRPDAAPEWADTGQWARGLDDLRRPWCPDAVFTNRVRFEPVDMNAIPFHLRDFDLTWSCGSFEHIGGFDQSIEFFSRQMQCLCRGGLAVHTTEYAPQNDQPTLNAPTLVSFRLQELQRLIDRVTADGGEFFPLDVVPGDEPEDLRIDVEPYTPEHLSLRIGHCVTTSIVLIAQKI